MTTNDTRHLTVEGLHLVVLRMLVWVGATLVFVTPLAGTAAIILSALAAAGGVVLARYLAASRWRWPWTIVGSAALIGLGITGGMVLGSSTLLARLFGPGHTLTLVELMYFGPLVLGLVTSLRTVSLRFPWMAFLEAGAIAGAVAYSFRSHRQFPFSQPQDLSDWAFIEGYDPRYLLMSIGMATLVGIAVLLLPRHSFRRSAVAIAMLLLLAWLVFPWLIGGPLSTLAESAQHTQDQQQDEPPPPPNQTTPPQEGPGQPIPPVKGREQQLPPGKLLSHPPKDRKPPPPPPPVQSKDPPPSVTIDDAKVEEGNAGSAALVFTVKLSAAADKPVIVNYQTSDGSARGDSDFQPARGAVTIPAGQTEAKLSINVNGDTDEEANETMFVSLATVKNAQLTRDRAQGVILNDDHDPPPPSISVDDVEVLEGNVGQTPAAFTVTLSEATTKAVTVNYDLVPGTAKPDQDYRVTKGTLTIPPGEIAARIVVQVLGDTDVEEDETYTVKLAKPVNAVFKKPEGKGLIKNDDIPPPELAIEDVRVSEGQRGTTPATFVLKLSRPADKPIQVSVVTIGVSATPDVDFVARQGAITIPAGEEGGAITVEVNGDTQIEPNEIFLVQLSDPVNAKLVRDTGVGIIDNDDVEPPPPVLSISDAKVVEGHDGRKLINFELSLSAPHPKPVQVDVTTAGDTATGGEDFVAGRQSVTIPAGDSKLKVGFEVKGDTDIEADETLIAQLSNPVNTKLGRATAVGLIVNDDFEPAPPLLSINDVTLAEGHEGVTKFSFVISLSAAATKQVEVDVAMFSATAHAEEDFHPKAGAAMFAPGKTAVGVTVDVVGDKIREDDEFFVVQLSNAKNALLVRDTGVGTILNDDEGPPLPKLSISDAKCKEGDAGDTPLQFVITLSEPSDKPVDVKLLIVNDTAQDGEDVHGLQGQITIPAGQNRANVTVHVKGDKTVEEDERFSVKLSEPNNATLDRDSGQGTIENDDQEMKPPDPPEDDPKISIDDISADEGNAGTTALSFKVTLSTATNKEVKVDYDVTGDTATVDKDFRPASGTLAFPPGATTGSVTVDVVGDLTVEDDETLTVKLSKPVNGILERDQATGTILDDDDVLIEIHDVTVDEGDEGVAKANFQVTLSEKSPDEITVEWATADETALAEGDYHSAQGTLTFPPGQTEATVSVEVVGEKDVETDEEFKVKLSKAHNATIDRGTGFATITNDDKPKISITDVKVDEGDKDTTSFTFKVTISGAISKPVTVHYATQAGTAKADEDFRPAEGDLTIDAGDVEATVTIDVVGDEKIERDEKFEVVLSKPENGELDKSTGTGTIRNDDKPKLSIEDTKIDEGNTGTATARFALKLSEPYYEDVSVQFQATAGTAQAEKDFQPQQSTATIAAGAKEGGIQIDVVGDTLVELDEKFDVKLHNPVNAKLEREKATGTIIDDDLPTIAIEDFTAEEGNSGATPFAVKFKLSAATNHEVTARYKTVAGTAAENDDFKPATATVTIPAGQAEATITIEVVGDTKIERHETFEVVLSEAKGGTLERDRATVTITNDDKPTISIGDIAVEEGNEKTKPCTFVLRLSEPHWEVVRVRCDTKPDTAEANKDFMPLETFVVFPPGQVEMKAEFQIVGDTVTELNEFFYANLADPVNATIERGSGKCEIIDDDPPTLKISDVTIEEGNSGTTPAVFELELSAAISRDASVEYEAYSRTATLGSDFGANKGTLVIPAGQTKATLSVEVIGDKVVEPDETFNLLLVNTTNCLRERTFGTCTIKNDDVEPPPPAVTIGDVTVNEGNAGTTAAQFTITLSDAGTSPVKFNYATMAGTATSETDFRPASGVVTVPAGETDASITVDVIGDTQPEEDETFVVKLSNVVGGKLAVDQATGTIHNDDEAPPLPSVSIEDLKLDEGNQNTTPFAFKVVLSAASERDVQVSYATGGGNADPAEDYKAAEGVLTIPKGQTEKLLEIAVVGDTTHEEDETFLVRLSGPQGATLDREQATGTITNDDPQPPDEPQPEDEFEWSSSGPPPLTPLAVVKFRDDYEPLEKGYYFRTFAYSQLDGTRIVRSEARDNDVAWSVPTARQTLSSRAPTEVLRDLATTVYTVGAIEAVPLLMQPGSVEPIENKVSEEFSGVFSVTSLVLANGRRNGASVDAYRELAGGKASDPSWDEETRKQYLAIPDDARYRELAREIAGTLDSRQRTSSFARAMAIRKWMENNLTFDYDTSHRDASDRTASFLFGNRRGYCIHFAHAMVMLLRAQDVPARLAMGYRVASERRGQRGSLLVYASDAHSWAEMYVDGIGWVIIESGSKGRIPPPDPEPDPKELDHYLSLLGDIPPQVFAESGRLWGTVRTATVVAAPSSFLWALLGLYGIKYWRLLRPRYIDAARLHRIGYRATLDLFAAAGVRRRYGETWDDYAERLRDISPEFVELTNRHLEHSFGRGTAINEKEWRAMQAKVVQQIAEKVPRYRRWLGMLNPVSWIGVG